MGSISVIWLKENQSFTLRLVSPSRLAVVMEHLPSGLSNERESESVRENKREKEQGGGGRVEQLARESEEWEGMGRETKRVRQKESEREIAGERVRSREVWSKREKEWEIGLKKRLCLNDSPHLKVGLAIQISRRDGAFAFGIIRRQQHHVTWDGFIDLDLHDVPDLQNVKGHWVKGHGKCKMI